MSYIEAHTNKHPAQSLTIKYEDMNARPEVELRRAFEFLGAAHDDATVGEIAEATSFGKQAKGEFFRKGISGDWLNHFTDQNRQDFDRLAGQVLIDMNYETSSDWAR